MEDDDGHKEVGRARRWHQSKNLVAERKRRKKLNDRLYLLLSLVPKISKMDRASILGDAIKFVKELQKQVKDLQDELEETPGDEEQKENCNNNDNVQLAQIPVLITGVHEEIRFYVQVEVSQVNGNEFFLKAFWEQKPARFVRLMEAINSLGLEVTNAHVITFRGLVLNDFKVKKRENEVVHADQARDSLLELIFNPNGGRPKSGCIGENGGSDHHHHHHYHHH